MLKQPSHAGGGDLSRATAMAVVGVLLVVGFALRAYHLGSLCITLDEFGSALQFIRIGSLKMYMNALQIVQCDYSPGYMVLQYYLLRFLGTGLWQLRLVPVLVNCATLPLAYATTTRLFGRKAGVIAMGCLALSPMCVWWSQGIRPYAFIVPITLVSLYTFIRAYQSGSKRWMLANIATDFFMVFGILPTLASLVASEMLFLALNIRKRHALVWCAGKGLAPVLLVAYAMTRPYVNTTVTSGAFSWADAPWSLLWRSTISLDSLYLNVDIPQPERALRLADPMTFVNVLLAGLITCGLVWLGVRAARNLLGRVRRRAKRQEPSGGSDGSLLLLAVVLVPPILAIVASYLIQRREMHPRYSMQVLPAVYAAMGGAIAALRWKHARRLACALLAALYLCQIPTFLLVSKRADWIGAAKAVQKQETPNDLVLVTGEFMSGEVFDCNVRLGHVPLKALIAAAPTMQAAVDATVNFLGRNNARAGTQDRAVWLACQHGSWTEPRDGALEDALVSLGFPFSVMPFYGGDTVLLYHVTSPPHAAMTAPPAIPPAPVTVWEWNDRDPNALLAKLEASGMPITPEEREAYAGRLHRVAFMMIYDAWDYGMASILATCAGDWKLGAALAREVNRVMPRQGISYVALAAALEAGGDDEGARRAVKEAFRQDPALAENMAPAATALWDGTDPAAAADELVRLRACNIIFSLPFFEVCRHRFGVGAPVVIGGVYATRLEHTEPLERALCRDVPNLDGLNPVARAHIEYLTHLWTSRTPRT